MYLDWEPRYLTTCEAVPVTSAPKGCSSGADTCVQFPHTVTVPLPPPGLSHSSLCCPFLSPHDFSNLQESAE